MNKVKVFLIIASLLAVSVAQGQLRFGVKGGVNVATAKFSKEVADAKNITGFNIGPVLELMFGELGFGLDGAVLYTQKGFKSADETAIDSYLEVPVNLKYKFNLPGIQPYLAAGPYVDFKVSGDNMWDVSTNTQGIKDQIKAKNFSAGLNFGAGVELIHMIQVGINLNWGLTDNYNKFVAGSLESYKGKTITWSGSAIVFF